MASLVKHVAVKDEYGVLHSFGPGDEVPAWAERLITNPGVWDSASTIEAVDDVDGPPPKAGKGSGEGPWRAYAAQKGVDVSSADGRDSVISVLRDAGVPVE